ncbi:MAG: hypothetical protein QG622_1968 [Actinomycetota bacterium]|nr:hypothetical protein [Actinomycetota bacterium]
MLAAEPGIKGELSHELSRHARLLHLAKTRMHIETPTGLDAATFGLLMSLVKNGPVRQGELAGNCLLDPSTVSRYVGQLVRAGLVTRRPDPADGRAVQLVLTDEGRGVGARVQARREELIAQLLAGWSLDDAHTFVRLMRRLNDEMETLRDTIQL